jgi:hypothetical protein
MYCYNLQTTSLSFTLACLQATRMLMIELAELRDWTSRCDAAQQASPATFWTCIAAAVVLLAAAVQSLSFIVCMNNGVLQLGLPDSVLLNSVVAPAAAAQELHSLVASTAAAQQARIGGWMDRRAVKGGGASSCSACRGCGAVSLALLHPCSFVYCIQRSISS